MRAVKRPPESVENGNKGNEKAEQRVLCGCVYARFLGLQKGHHQEKSKPCPFLENVLHYKKSNRYGDQAGVNAHEKGTMDRIPVSVECPKHSGIKHCRDKPDTKV